MSANILQNERDQKFKIAFNPTKKMEWIVRENAKLQAELNRLPKKGEELTSQVVHKVVDRIKDL